MSQMQIQTIQAGRSAPFIALSRLDDERIVKQPVFEINLAPVLARIDNTVNLIIMRVPIIISIKEAIDFGWFGRNSLVIVDHLIRLSWNC